MWTSRIGRRLCRQLEMDGQTSSRIPRLHDWVRSTINVAFVRSSTYMAGGLSTLQKGVSFESVFDDAPMRPQPSLVRSTREMGCSSVVSL